MGEVADRSKVLQDRQDSQSRESNSKRERFSEIDFIKAIAIVVVVVIHSLSDTFFKERSSIESFLTDWTRFAVPWFLFAAGFLFVKSTDIPTSQLLYKSASRILPPYWICSAYWIATRLLFTDDRQSVGRIIKSLFFCETHGIYYFVFVICYLYVFGAMLRFASRSLVIGLWLLSLALYIATILTWPAMFFPTKSFGSMLRSPFIHTVPFLTGWVVSLWYTPIRRIIGSLPLSAASGLVIIDTALVLAIAPIDRDLHWRELLISVHVYLLLVFALHVSIASNIQWSFIRLLSEWSYGIYLTHIVFVEFCHRQFRYFEAFEMPGRILITATISTLITLAFLATLRAVLGKRSRLLIGA